MENIWILPVAIFVILDLAALYVVIEEDLLYTAQQKFYKLIFVLIVPFIGAIVELYLLSRYAKFKGNGSYPDDEVKWYAFWNYYSKDKASGNSHDSNGNLDGGSRSSGGVGD